VFGADGGDDTREAEIYACCEERRSDGEAYDLDKERVLNDVSLRLTD
jgi:hypothetical protein